MSMDYYLNRNHNQFYTAKVASKNITFPYRNESRRKYSQFNTFIQGMEFVKATATISTTAKVGLVPGDKVRLDNGLELKFVNMEAYEEDRRAMLSKNTVRRWLINLE